MRLYIDAGRAPNPRRVRIFLAEKGVSVPTEAVDIGAQAHKAPAFRAVNPMQRLPALLLDDGTAIAESIAICRYIEALHPAPPLFGEGAREQALVEMWQRRVELHLLSVVSSVFRHLHPAMAALEVRRWPPGARRTSRECSTFWNSLMPSSRDVPSWRAPATRSPTSRRWWPSTS